MTALTHIPQGPPARRFTESEVDQFSMTSYVLIQRTHHCSSCNAIQSYSDLYEVWTHPTKTARTKAKILKVTPRIEPGFSIDTVVTPAIDVPICQECVYDNHEPTTLIFPPVSYSAWADTLQRKALSAAIERREAAARRTTPEPSLEQL